MASPPGAFLGVERSARGLRWVERLDSDQANAATAIAQGQGVPDLLARVIAARGATAASASEYFGPTLRAMMPDPASLQDMERASERLARAVREGETVAVFGDYDVDGAASAALLHRFLAAHGLPPRIYIPDRLTEGYGPNAEAFEQLITEAGAKLLVTVDCGTTSHAALARARELGADVIVVDHHLADEELPDAEAIVNPNRHDDLSGLGQLAAAGVTFMLLAATQRVLRRAGWYGGERSEPDLLSWLDLVALATVCDVVPLQGLNRAFVTQGLKVMGYRRNIGLRTLCDTAGLTSQPTPYHLGFVLGPRINSGGRIGDAGLGARLLSTQDEIEAKQISQVLERLNVERKAAETAMLEEAMIRADALLEANPQAPILAVASDGWHKGIVGLIASRLAERFRRPALVVGWDGKGEGTGSARSIAGVDIGHAVKQALQSGLLLKGGGHPMAAGLTVKRDGFEALIEGLGGSIAASVTLAGRNAELAVDGALMAAGATPDLLAMLDQAGPYGNGNPEPRFAFAAHHCMAPKVVGGAHVRCTLRAPDGARIGAIAFRSADTELGELLGQAAGRPLHVAGHLRRDNWGGREKIELVIEDAADPRGSRN
jgi:single-stranded-DNA-specific exonuclease